MRRTLIAILAALLVLPGCRRDDPLSTALESGDLAAVQHVVRNTYPDVPIISTEALAAALNGPVESRPVVIDCRQEVEFAVSHLPGAIRDGGDRPIPPDVPLVLYCSVGVRSSERARALMATGRSDVLQLDGSIFRWAIEHRPMEDAAGKPTSCVHPYDRNWGRLLPVELNSEFAR